MFDTIGGVAWELFSNGCLRRSPSSPHRCRQPRRRPLHDTVVALAGLRYTDRSALVPFRSARGITAGCGPSTARRSPGARLARQTHRRRSDSTVWCTAAATSSRCPTPPGICGRRDLRRPRRPRARRATASGATPTLPSPSSSSSTCAARPSSASLTVVSSTGSSSLTVTPPTATPTRLRDGRHLPPRSAGAANSSSTAPSTRSAERSSRPNSTASANSSASKTNTTA